MKFSFHFFLLSFLNCIDINRNSLYPLGTHSRTRRICTRSCIRSKKSGWRDRWYEFLYMIPLIDQIHMIVADRSIQLILASYLSYHSQNANFRTSKIVFCMTKYEHACMTLNGIITSKITFSHNFDNLSTHQFLKQHYRHFVVRSIYLILP